MPMKRPFWPPDLRLPRTGILLAVIVRDPRNEERATAYIPEK